MSSMDLTCNASNNKDSNDLEEECSEQEESSDEYESIQRPAFLVEGEPDFESGPPEDGLEYLRRVRYFSWSLGASVFSLSPYMISSFGRFYL